MHSDNSVVLHFVLYVASVLQEKVLHSILGQAARRAKPGQLDGQSDEKQRGLGYPRAYNIDGAPRQSCQAWTAGQRVGKRTRYQQAVVI